MAAGAGESPHPPRSSWGSGPRPPKRALTCATRRCVPSGRAAPCPAALPLRAPPRPGVLLARGRLRGGGARPRIVPAPVTLFRRVYCHRRTGKVLLRPACTPGEHPGRQSPLIFPSQVRGRRAVPEATRFSCPPTLTGLQPWDLADPFWVPEPPSSLPHPREGVLGIFGKLVA